MKKNRQTKSLNLSNSRWLAYAAAGAATTLGGAQSAEAEIHYSGVINAKFHYEGGSRQFPILHSARLRFLFYTYSWFFSVKDAMVSNNFCGSISRHGARYVSRLHEGAVISSCAFLPGSGNQALLLNSYADGQFAKGGFGFIGFRFNNGAGVQYGWARSRSKGNGTSDFMLVDYAWADPGESITAGQTSLAGDMVDAVTESGSVGLLALGAAGLVAWRKRRSRTAGPDSSSNA
jgi:hypothetical protein